MEVFGIMEVACLLPDAQTGITPIIGNSLLEILT
jgi:hypothetical protein